jgi:protein-tyrosine phosphatase
VFGWLKTKKQFEQPLKVDLHSHLLPGLDDGVKSFEEAEAVIRGFQAHGYTKIITTPHVMSDAYRNTPETILGKLNELKQYLHAQNITMDLHAAAEYYLDEDLMQRLSRNEPLLTLGKQYVLFETNFLTEPLTLKEFIFQATSKGYKLILAHPERYMYLQDDLKKAEDLIDRGVLFQVNISSLSGHYSKPAQKAAQRLIDRGWIHWLASDCHQPSQLPILRDAMQTKYFAKAITLPLLNNSLL